MFELMDWALGVWAVLVAIPLAVLGTEAFASLLPVRRDRTANHRPTCAILMPAHDEEVGIARAIRGVFEQTSPGDRLLVVADNCGDRTAEVARNAGAEVLERTDPERRGKGYALDFGLRHLGANPPEVVAVVDADCDLGPGALDAIVRQVGATNRPAQGVYLIGTGREADPKQRLSAFAVLVKNKVRPLGLHRLGLPCLLTGTGMAFPWEAIPKVEVGSGNIVEDMKLGVDLALAGYEPRLCPEAELSSAAAPSTQGTAKQRTRWEHGHVQTLVTQSPRLIGRGVFGLRPKLVGLGLELAVPPLSLLLVLWAVGAISWGAWSQLAGGSSFPGLIFVVAIGYALTGLLGAWVKFGRKTLPFLTLLGTPVYIAWKLPIYLKLVKGREKSWVRTDRANR